MELGSKTRIQVPLSTAPMPLTRLVAKIKAARSFGIALVVLRFASSHRMWLGHHALDPILASGS